MHSTMAQPHDPTSIEDALGRQLQETLAQRSLIEERERLLREQIGRARSLSQHLPPTFATVFVADASPGPSLQSPPQYLLSTSPSGGSGCEAPAFKYHTAAVPRTKRSQSSTGYEATPMVRSPPMKRQRTYSHAAPSSAPMIRTPSLCSDRGSGCCISLASAGPGTPMPPVSASSHLARAQHRYQRPRQTSELAVLPETIAPDVGVDIDVFLALRESFDLAVFAPPQPHQLPTSTTQNMPRGLLTPSTCPSVASGQSAAEDAPLSRASSNVFMSRTSSSIGTGSITDAMEMARIDSTYSQHLVPRSGLQLNGMFGEDLFAEVGAKISQPAMPDPFSALSYTPCQPEPTRMERSASGASGGYGCSPGSSGRIIGAARRHIQNGKIAIQPKPKRQQLLAGPPPAPSLSTSAPSSSASAAPPVLMPPVLMPGRVSKPAASKAVISKPVIGKGPYQRVRHPKVFCHMCSDYPAGFRGDHELRRHSLTKHRGQVKRFVCRDPVKAGIATNVRVVRPLDKCKFCASRKEYNAYYNAAAHLRRTHFRPKTTRGKRSEARSPTGKDWPSMNDIRPWFEEITVDLTREPPSSRPEARAAENPAAGETGLGGVAASITQDMFIDSGDTSMIAADAIDLTMLEGGFEMDLAAGMMAMPDFGFDASLEPIDHLTMSAATVTAAAGFDADTETESLAGRP